MVLTSPGSTKPDQTASAYKQMTDSGIEIQSLIIVGIPAYNEEKTIASIVLGAQKHAHIVMVCDDGSRDMTAEIAERLGAVVVRHERNRGYGAALQSLFKRAKELNADIFVTIDSDGQHDPSEIPRLTLPIENREADVVLGSRFIDKTGIAEMPSYRKFGIKLITKFSNASGKNQVSDSQSGFRAYSKSAMTQIGEIYESGMSASLELICAINKANIKVIEVPVTCKYSSSIGVETSTEHPLSHGVALIMAVVRLVVEDRPITFLGIPGIVSIVFGFLFGIWMMNIYAVEGQIVTNLAIASLAFVLLGFFMVSTAITLYAITRIRNKISPVN